MNYRVYWETTPAKRNPQPPDFNSRPLTTQPRLEEGEGGERRGRKRQKHRIHILSVLIGFAGSKKTLWCKGCDRTVLSRACRDVSKSEESTGQVSTQFYYMASSVSGQDESNPALWLATRAGKMELSCPLGTTRLVPQEKFPRKPYSKSFIDQACSVKMAWYGPRSFFAC